MKNKSRLAFEQLEFEMEVLCKEKQISIVGSTGAPDPGGVDNSDFYYRMQGGGTDCFFKCLGYANNMMGGSNDSAYYSTAYDFYYGNASNGVSVSVADQFASNYFVQQNINNSVPGNMANFANGTDGVLIGTYSTSVGQHAVIITHIYSNGLCDYYDPQNNISGTRNTNNMTHFLALTGVCQ